MTHKTNRKPMPRQNLERLSRRLREFRARYRLDDDSIEHSAIDQLAALRRESIMNEEIMALNWINHRDTAAFQDLVTSILTLQFRVAMGMKFAGDDWVDILHDAVVSALTSITRMKTYDRVYLESNISLAVIEAQRRHITRMGRSLNGPNRPTKTRAAAHLSGMDLDNVDDRDIHNICARSGISMADMTQMHGWLSAEDTSDIPDMSDAGKTTQDIETALDIARVRDIIPHVLDTRSADILQRRFLCEDPVDRSVLAEKWDITETRIGQLERAACKDLRRFLETPTLPMVPKVVPTPAQTEVPEVRTILKPVPVPAQAVGDVEPVRRSQADLEIALERMRARAAARGPAFSMEHFASFSEGQY